MTTKTYAFIAAMAICAVSCVDKGRAVDAPEAGALTVPFQGNVLVTEAPGEFYRTAEATIDTGKGTLLSWDDSGTVLSLFFKTDRPGPLHLQMKASLPEGTSRSCLTFSAAGRKCTVKVASHEDLIYDAGVFEIQDPGYVRIDMEGAAPEGEQFARVSEFYLSGEAAEGECNYTTPEHVADNYWYRRGPSVHFNFTLPEDDVEWYYNEATVPEGFTPASTYYMLTGFAEGYMGIQTHDGTPNSVLFSVWSPFKTDNPREIPDDQRIKTLRKGEGVTAKDFGGEGSGGQSFMKYDWKPGVTYSTLVHVRPTGDGSTDYTGYFKDENGVWHLLASFRRPHTDTWCKKAHSFLECFQPETTIHTREVLFGNQWALTREGEWKEITEARFTCDQTGRLGMRADLYGAVEDGRFLLRNCGFFNEKTEYGTMFTRPAGGVHPEIDFEALENL